MTTDLTRCFRGDSAPCACACPFGLDVRSFTDKLRRGSFDAAFKIYRNAVVFPDIVSRLCPAPCKSRCVLRKGAGAIEMPALEAACFRWARNTDPIAFNIPPKQKRAAIVGAGVSGLACALRVAGRGYRVTVYEKAAEPGGALRDRLPREVYLADIDRQFKYTDFELVLNREIRSLDEIEADAVYIATGAGGRDFALASGVNPATCETPQDGVFLGGELLSGGTIEAIEAGLRAARNLERFLITGRMLREVGEEPAEEKGTRLKDAYFSLSGAPPTVAADGTGYSKDEAKAEAERCLRCDCNICLDRCDLMAFFRVQPKTLKERVDGTFIKGGAIMEGNAKRLIAACNACAACGDHCPEGIDIGEFLLESRRRLHRAEDMPAAWYDFWVRDMVFAGGGEAALCRPAPGSERAKYLYFPGCQLGASDPRYVTESYRRLLEHEPDTALLLACCGAPAAWAGREEQHAAVAADIRSKWEKLGRPATVLACPTCRQMLRRAIPEMECVSVYELMAPWGAPKTAEPNTVAIFDPCSSRREPDMQESVRALLRGAGLSVEELPASRGEALCCGYGGTPAGASRGYFDTVVQKRVSQSALPYACYCANCRDSFAGAGKEAYHVFDLLFGLSNGDRKAPDVSGRRENRRTLRRRLLQEIWQERTEEGKAMKLEISPELRERLDQDLILEDDIRTVIESCEKSGRKLRDTANGSFIGHLAIGPVTYWAEYKPVEGGYKVLNAYSHRLVLQERKGLPGKAGE